MSIHLSNLIHHQVSSICANDLCEKSHSCTQYNKFPFLWKLYSKDCGCIGIHHFQYWFEVSFQSCFKFHLFTDLYFFLPTFSSISHAFFFFFLLTPSFGLYSLAFPPSSSPHTFLLSSCQKYLWKPFLVTRVFPHTFEKSLFSIKKFFSFEVKRDHLFLPPTFKCLALSVDKRWMWYF